MRSKKGSDLTTRARRRGRVTLALSFVGAAIFSFVLEGILSRSDRTRTIDEPVRREADTVRGELLHRGSTSPNERTQGAEHRASRRDAAVGPLGPTTAPAPADAPAVDVRSVPNSSDPSLDESGFADDTACERQECPGDLATAAFSGVPPPVADLAALTPGLRIDASNAPHYVRFLTPSIVWLIRQGAHLQIAAYARVQPPPPLVEATRRYACHTTLSASGASRRCYVAGLPFPLVDPADPLAATKLMYDHEAATAVDDLEITGIECDTGSVPGFSEPLKIEKHFVLEGLYTLRFAGRLIAPPLPRLEPNPSQTEHQHAAYPLLEPFDLKGAGVLAYRYLDPRRQDDTWLYVPVIRRVRRASSAQRSDAFFGQIIDIDSAGGFSGNVAWTTWRYLGEKTVLAPFHARSFPVRWRSDGVSYLPDESWEPRRVWIIEGVSKVPNYAYGKRMIYLDQETYRILYTEIYDQHGQLWKLLLNSHHFSDRPFPGIRAGGSWQHGYIASTTAVDLQLWKVTYCGLPSPTTTRRAGWTIDAGAASHATVERFSIAGIMAGSN